MKDLLVRYRQFIVFLFGGFLSAAIDVGSMQFFIYAGKSIALATTIGFASGLMVNYIFHAKVTFQRVALSANFIRYACLVAFNYFLTLGLVTLAVMLSGNAILGKIASLPIVALNGFFLGKYWIFK